MRKKRSDFDDYTAVCERSFTLCKAIFFSFLFLEFAAGGEYA